MKKAVLPLIVLFLIACGGCSNNTASHDPWELGGNAISSGYLLSGQIESRKLVITETADGMGTEAGTFPIQVDCNISIDESDGIKEWAVEKAEFPSSHFILRKDSDGRVYLTKASKDSLQEADTVEITGYLKEAGIKLSNIVLRKAELDYAYSNSYLNFEISDGKKSALFLSRWSPYNEYLSTRDEKKHIETIPLYKYKIVDTAFNYESDNGMDIHEVYALKERNRYYLILWEEKLKKFSRYEIPAEAGALEELYYNTGPVWQPGDLEMAGKLYLKSKDPKSDEISVYEVNLREGAMRKFVKAAELEGKFPLQWKFTGELQHNYILDDTGKALVVYGDDGGISGFHSHKYLYGIDKETGKKLWQVYGGYGHMSFSLSKDGKRIFVGVRAKDNVPPEVLCIDMETGSPVWKKVFDDFADGLVNVTAVEKGVAVEFSSFNDSGDIRDKSLKVLDRDNGNPVWEKKLKEDEYLVTCMNEIPTAPVAGDRELKAYEAGTGAVKWSVRGALRATSRGLIVSTPDYPMVESPEFMSKTAAGNRMWFAFEDGFKELDLVSGRILNAIDAAGKVQVVFLDDTLAVIKSGGEEGVFLQDGKGFALYSLTEKRELWDRDEVFYGAVLHGDKLIYYTDSSIRCVDRNTGEPEWEGKFPFVGAKAALIVDNEVLVTSRGRLFSFDLSTGKPLYQEAGRFMGGAPWRDWLDYYSTMRISGSGLLISNISGDLDLLGLE